MIWRTLSKVTHSYCICNIDTLTSDTNITAIIPIARDLDIPELILDVIDGDVADNVASDDPLKLRHLLDIQATYGHSHIIPDMSRTLPNTCSLRRHRPGGRLPPCHFSLFVVRS